MFRVGMRADVQLSDGAMLQVIAETHLQKQAEEIVARWLDIQGEGGLPFKLRKVGFTLDGSEVTGSLDGVPVHVTHQGGPERKLVDLPEEEEPEEEADDAPTVTFANPPPARPTPRQITPAPKAAPADDDDDLIGGAPTGGGDDWDLVDTPAPKPAAPAKPAGKKAPPTPLDDDDW